MSALKDLETFLARVNEQGDGASFQVEETADNFFILFSSDSTDTELYWLHGDHLDSLMDEEMFDLDKTPTVWELRKFFHKHATVLKFSNN